MADFQYQGLEGFDAVLKEDYADKVRYAMTEKRYLLDQLERANQPFNGREFVFPTHIGRSSGLGFRGENGTAPPAGSQEYVDGYVRPKKIMLKVQVSNEVDIQSRGKTGAFIRAMASEMERIVPDAKELMSKSLFGDGSGIDAFVSSSTGAPSTTVNVKGYLNWRDGSTGTTAAGGGIPACAGVPIPNGTHGLMRRSRFGVGPSPQFVSGAAFEVGTIDAITKGTSLTSSGAVTVALNEIVGSAHAATLTEHGVGKAIQGMLAAISDEDAWNNTTAQGWGFMDVSDLNGAGNKLVPYNGYCNILRSDHPEWKSEVLDNGGDLRPISEDLFEDAFGRVQQHSDIEPSDMCIIMHQSLYKKWVKLFKADRRFVNTVEFKGGYKLASFEYAGQNVKILIDRHAPYHTAIGLHEPSAQWFVGQDFEWEEAGGGIIKVSENGSYKYAKMEAHKQFAVMEPYKCFLIRDLEADESSFGA